VNEQPQPPDLSRPGLVWLERVTAFALGLVVLLLAWMLLAAYGPGWARLASVEAEVVAVLALLTAALGLVSVLALLHTRG
jgi:hypothetical protein